MEVPHDKFKVASKCDTCPSACCWYLCVELLQGNLDAEMLDQIRYYLMHEGVMILFMDGSWHIYFQSKCKYIVEGKKFRCAIYPQRPTICKDHGSTMCNEKEWFLDGVRPDDELLFKTVEEFDSWRKSQAAILSE